MFQGLATWASVAHAEAFSFITVDALETGKHGCIEGKL
jgi:hypothetical protein